MEKATILLKKYRWVLPVLLSIFVCMVLIALAGEKTEGMFIYPLDDSYIHLALAKQLASSGDWGLNPDMFNPCSSSPVFTLLLTGAIWLIGNYTLIPLAINFLLLIFLSYHLFKFLDSPIVNGNTTTSIICILLILTPVHLLILCGMEHMLHLCMLLLLWRVLFKNEEGLHFKSKKAIIFYCLLALLPLTRYESLFLIGPICLMLFVRGSFRLGIIGGAASILSVSAYGLWAISKGGYFFPNSILLKGHLPIQEFDNQLFSLSYFVENLYSNPFMLILLIGNAAIVFREVFRDEVNDKYREIFWANLVVLVATVGHLLFAQVGGYRYEAYLIMLGGISCLIGLSIEINHLSFTRLKLERIGAIGVFLLIILFPFSIRAGFFTTKFPLASQNVYHQHYQIANFVKEMLPDATIGLNDIGAVAYFTDAKVIDLVGIANMDIARARKRGTFDKDAFKRITSDAEMEYAIIHESWIGNRIPDDWISVQKWTIPNNFITADPTMSFYSCENEYLQKMNMSLSAFRLKLPREISISE